MEERKTYVLTMELEGKKLINVCKSESSFFLPDLLKVLKSISEDQERSKIITHQSEPKKEFVITEEVRKVEWESDFYLQDFEKIVRSHKLVFTSSEEANEFFKPLLVKIIRLINHEGIKRVILKYCRGKNPIFYDFKTFESNYGPKKGYTYRILDPKTAKLETHWWFELLYDPSILTYYDADWVPYHPLEQDPTFNTNQFNLFQKFKAQPISSKDYSEILPIINHIHEVWANGNLENAVYIMTWLAHLALKPREWLPMLTLIGGEGVGKTTIIQWMIDEIFGEGICGNVYSLDEATKKFNGVIYNKFLTYIQELKAVSDTSISIQNKMDKFKSMITDRRILVERKGIDAYHMTNYNHWIGTSNHNIPFSIHDGNRRHAIFHCSNKYQQNKDYFDVLHSHLTPQNANIFYDYLLHYPIKIDVYKIPLTDSLKSIINMSLPLSQRFVHELNEGETKILFYNNKDQLILMSSRPGDSQFQDPLMEYNSQDKYVINKQDFYSLFMIFCKKSNVENRYITGRNKFYEELKNLVEEVRLDGKRCFIIPKEWTKKVEIDSLEFFS
jgi:hypothetical protein